MLENLVISILAAAGFVCSWSLTNIKAHILGVFPSLRGKDVYEIEDEISSLWGFWGELLNCPYCLGSWVAAIFFCVFSALPQSVSFVIAAFFIAPAIIRFCALDAPTHSTEQSAHENDVSQEDNTEYEFTAPYEIQKRILAIKDDPAKHREFVKKNSFLINLLHNSKSCPSDECKQIAQAYRDELARMELAHEKNPAKCPNCVRGQVINKYIFMLHNLLGDQEVSLENPQSNDPFQSKEESPEKA